MTVPNEFTTEPQPNLPLLRKILDHIDAHPEEHDQGDWENVSDCGTTRCVGGWAEYFVLGRSAKAVDGPEAQADALLGLTRSEAYDLFYGTLNPCQYGINVPDDCMGLSREDARAAERAAVQIVAERIAARAGEVL